MQQPLRHFARSLEDERIAPGRVRFQQAELAVVDFGVDADFSQIVARWPELWPKIYEMLTTTLESPPMQSPGDVLEMKLPSAAIELGPEWLVSVRFYNTPGAWVVSFEGWKMNARLSAYGYNA